MKFIFFLLIKLVFFLFYSVNVFSNDSWEKVLREKGGNITLYYFDSESFIKPASNNKVTGIEAAIFEEFVSFVNDEYGVKLKFKYQYIQSFQGLYDTIKLGKSGFFGASSFSITEQRRQEIKFSPSYLPDIEILIASENVPLITEKSEFLRVFSKLTALAVKGSTFEKNLFLLKKEMPNLKIMYLENTDEIRNKIMSEKDYFGYSELPNYLLLLKSGKKINRINLYKIEREGYSFIMPQISDWDEPLKVFFSSKRFKSFIEIKAVEYFGKEIKELINVISEKNSDDTEAEIALLNNEKAVQNLALKTKELDLAQKNNYLIAAFAGGVILLILAYLFYNRSELKNKANLVLEEKHKEIALQRDVLNEQNHIIQKKNEDITNSIVYAKRIQDAMLPSLTTINAYFEEIFVLYLPKDIVSGDMFWFSDIHKNYQQQIFLASVDCTGHGVPGALMCMLADAYLNQIVNLQQVFSPDEILENLSLHIKKALKQEESNNKDGMDMTICAINQSKNEILFSSANRSVIIAEKGEYVEFKGTKRAIGGIEKTAIKPFEVHKISMEVHKGKMFYLFTDGFQDQFGGEQDTKILSKNFKQLLAKNSHLPAAEQKILLFNFFNQWKGKQSQTDDVLVIGFRI